MTTREVDTYTEEQAVFSAGAAARVARVSLAFVEHCEREELIETQVIVHGQKGFRRTAVRTLMRIRHLHEDLGLDLDAIDFILRMHDQMSVLRREMGAMEERLQRRERELQTEIRDLRRQLTEER